MKKSYDLFADYHDAIVRGVTGSSLEEEIEFLEEVIQRHKPDTKRIFEFACGTGIMASELVKRGYQVLGLDISDQMCQKARKNIGEENVICGDMRSYELKEDFDAVLCNYNSICHLTDFEDWKQTFKNAYNNLEKGGIFVFDINTIAEFETITSDFAQFYNIGADTVCLEMFKRFDHDPDSYGLGTHYEWLVKIFKADHDNNEAGKQLNKYTLYEEVVRENSFDINEIRIELEIAGFQVLEITDYHDGEKASEESERVYYVCRKK